MKDVTELIDFEQSGIDSESMPITECLCGKRFGYWEFTISVYEENAKECPSCHRKFYYVQNITVYEVP